MCLLSSRAGAYMRILSSFVVLAALTAAVVASTPAVADEKKGKKNAPTVDDLFGPSNSKGSGLDAMKKATEGMGTSKSKGDGLAAKVGTIDNEAGVQLLGVFAAERISQDKKMGCQPGGRDKKKVVEWTFNDLPSKG